MQPPEPPRELAAAHARHEHVGDQEVDRLGPLRGGVEGLVGVVEGQDGVAVGLQHLPGELAHPVVILDEQHGLGPDGRARFRGPCGRLADRGQVEGEGRPLPGLAPGGRPAAALPGEGVGRGEAEPAPLDAVPGADEGLEEVRLDGLGNAAAGVRHGEGHVGAGGHRVDHRRRVIQLHGRRLDREPAAGRHRLPGIGGEAREGLLELAGVRADPPRPGAQDERQGDLRSQELAQARGDATDERVDLDEGRLQELPPPERRELLREPDAALGRALDELHVAPHGIVHREPRQQELAPSRDHGQEIVEVVGDLARQARHGVQPMTQADLGLGALHDARLPRHGRRRLGYGTSVRASRSNGLLRWGARNRWTTSFTEASISFMSFVSASPISSRSTR
jgi:hypothetical protein